MAIPREDRAFCVVEVALSWCEDTGDCHFCGATGRAGSGKHYSDCLLVELGFVCRSDLRSRTALAPIRGFADFWTKKDLE